MSHSPAFYLGNRMEQQELIEELVGIVHKYQTDHGLMDYGFACDCSCEICIKAKEIIARTENL